MNNRVGFQGRLRQPVRVIVGSALAVALAACGGSGNGNTNTQVPNSFAYAVAVLGHTDYKSAKPNQTSNGQPIAVSGGVLNGVTGSIATDGTHFYIADTQNNRILGYNEVPKSGQAADFVIGQGDPSSSGDPNSNTPSTTATGLAFPNKVSISDDGKLVVADTGNNRVLIWNSLPTSNIQANVVIGQADFTSGYPNGSVSASAPTQSSLSNPTAAVIERGRLYVIDNNNNRMLIWNTVPTDLTNAPVPADVVWGQPSFTTNIANCGQGTVISGSNPVAYDCSLGNYPISQFSLNQPRDIWTDGYNVLVADSQNNRVLYWSNIPTSSTSVPSTVLGQGTFTSGAAGGTSSSALSSPYGVSSDGAFVYVADTSNNRVMIFSGFPKSDGQAAYTVLGQNYWNHKTANDDDQNQKQDANPTGRTLDLPTGVFAYVDPSGNSQAYVSDSANNRVLQFTPTLN